VWAYGFNMGLRFRQALTPKVQTWANIFYYTTFLVHSPLVEWSDDITRTMFDTLYYVIVVMVTEPAVQHPGNSPSHSSRNNRRQSRISRNRQNEADSDNEATERKGAHIT
jgi:hypothetical protein